MTGRYDSTLLGFTPELPAAGGRALGDHGRVPQRLPQQDAQLQQPVRQQTLLPALGRRSSAGHHDSTLLVWASYKRWCIIHSLQLATGREKWDGLPKDLPSPSQWTRRSHSKAWQSGACALSIR